MKQIIEGLDKSKFLSSEEKKAYYLLAQEMDDDLQAILLKVVQAKNSKDIENAKEEVIKYQIKRKQIIENKITEGLNSLYKSAEDLDNKESDKELFTKLEAIEN